MKKILVIFIILIGLYIVINDVFQFDWLSFSGSKDEHVQVSNQIDKIEINVGGVNTTIIPENRKDLRAKLDGDGKLTVDRDGDEIKVSVKVKWFNWFSFSNKTKLTIYLPDDYNEKMAINLGSGNLNFSGHSENQPMKLAELSLDVASGNLKLKNFEVDKFEHDGSSGNVKLDSLTTKSGSFDVSSGNLDVKHYTGPVNAQISSGELNIQLDKLQDSITIDLSSGDVELDLPDQADFTLNGQTSSGDITCDFPITSKNVGNKEIKGTHGSGKHKIDLQVSSGNISIY